MWGLIAGLVLVGVYALLVIRAFREKGDVTAGLKAGIFTLFIEAKDKKGGPPD